jgi:hypothetical protein
VIGLNRQETWADDLYDRALPAAPKPAFSASKTGSLKENQAIALFTFDPDQPGDLGIKKGDIINFSSSLTYKIYNFRVFLLVFSGAIWVSLWVKSCTDQDKSTPWRVSLPTGVEGKKAKKRSTSCPVLRFHQFPHILPTSVVALQEMDPLGVLASVVGLLTAAGTVSSILNTIRSNINDAPRLVDKVLSEVNDVEVSLSAVHKFLLGMSSAPRRRIALIQLDQLIATLTSAVLTFSELEALVIPLAVRSEMSIMERAKWAWKEDRVSSIVQRLQHHKSSLSLMLNIVQWYTLFVRFCYSL